MRRLFYTITSVDPLIITGNSDDPNMYETLEYIRGTIIQGLFVRNYLRNSRVVDETFYNLLIKGGCIFSNAYPSFDGELYHPAPLSLVSEKLDEGKIHNLINDLDTDFEVQTKGIPGLISLKSNKGSLTLSKISIRKEIRLHNEIDDNKKTTKEGILFNYQSLPAGLVFKGSITVRNDMECQTIKEIIKDRQEIRIGRSSTSEYGKGLFEWSHESDSNDQSTDDPVVMVLLSDGIFFNENGFASCSVNNINNYIPGATIIKTIAKRGRIEGFLNTWKLRKPSENVIVAGSSFLLDRLPSNASELAITGIGERIQEGYGQVSFSLLPLGTREFSIKKVDFPDRRAAIYQPTELTRTIIEFIMLNRKKREIILQALKDASATERPPTNHLIGKLKAISQIGASELKRYLKESIRKPAESQLKRAFVGNETLKDFLERRIDKFNDTFCQKTSVEDIEIHYNLQAHELQRLYFEHYFTQLRRVNK